MTIDYFADESNCKIKSGIDSSRLRTAARVKVTKEGKAGMDIATRVQLLR